MIHYSCDLCKRPLSPEDEVHYVVKLEIFAAREPDQNASLDSDRDNLQNLHEMLESIDCTSDDAIDNETGQEFRFDLCPECRKKYLKNPLGRKIAEQFDFSKN